MLQEARPVELDGRVLLLSFPAGAEFHKTQVEKQNYLEVIIDVLREMTGVELKVKCQVAEADNAPAGTTEAPDRGDDDTPTADDLIALFKAELDAEEIP